MRFWAVPSLQTGSSQQTLFVNKNIPHRSTLHRVLCVMLCAVLRRHRCSAESAPGSCSVGPRSSIRDPLLLCEEGLLWCEKLSQVLFDPLSDRLELDQEQKVVSENHQEKRTLRDDVDVNVYSLRTCMVLSSEQTSVRIAQRQKQSEGKETKPEESREEDRPQRKQQGERFPSAGWKSLYGWLINF